MCTEVLKYLTPSPGIISTKSSRDCSLTTATPAQHQTPATVEQGGLHPWSSVSTCINSTIPALLSPPKHHGHLKPLQKITVLCKASAKRKVTRLSSLKLVDLQLFFKPHWFWNIEVCWCESDQSVCSGGGDGGGWLLWWHQTPLQWRHNNHHCPGGGDSIWWRRSGCQQLFSLPASAASRCLIETKTNCTPKPSSCFTFKLKLLKSFQRFGNSDWQLPQQ